MSDHLLRVHNLRVRFRLGKQHSTEAVKGISFDIPRNATVALVGESGSGKSVTALSIMGLLPPGSSIDPASDLEFEGRDLLAMTPAQRRDLCGKEISMIFQDPMTSLNPVFSMGFQIGEVLRLHLGMNARQARERAIALLREVGIVRPEEKIDAYPSQLSGGQQQRVMIAMAIACAPKLLIADEPTTALDVTIQKQIIELIGALQTRRHMSVLFITHDLALVSEIAQQVIVMRDGQIREAGEVQKIFQAPRDAYTKALLRCRPSLDARPMRLPVIDDYMSGRGEPDAVRQQRGRGMTGAEGIVQDIVLEVRHLTKSFYNRAGLFRRREFRAVDDVSFKLVRGKTLGVVGESGSGKTTLGLTLLRLHEPTAGQALFEGRDMLAMPEKEFKPFKRRIQIIFQNPYASLNPRFTVGQILLEPMRIHRIGAHDRERIEIVAHLLDRVGLTPAVFHRYPHEFSGGQRQRIAIARCLALRPEVLVCDEPVSALDVSVQAQVLNLLQELQEEFGMSYIFISHDLRVVKHISDQVMVMNHGRVVEMGDADDLYRHPREAYTRMLVAAIPKGVGKVGAA